MNSGYISEFDDILNALLNKSKTVWKISNNFLTGKQNHAPLESVINNEIFNDRLNIVNSYFINVPKILQQNITRPSIKLAKIGNCHETLFLERATPNEILDIIGSLKKLSSIGVDDVSVRTVKEAANYLCSPFVHLINFCYENAAFLNLLKVAKIVLPLFKKVERNNISNSRPIATLFVFFQKFRKIPC